MVKRTVEEILATKNKVSAIDAEYKILFGVAIHSAKVIAKTNRRLYDAFISVGFDPVQSIELVKVTQLRAGSE